MTKRHKISINVLLLLTTGLVLTACSVQKGDLAYNGKATMNSEEYDQKDGKTEADNSENSVKEDTKEDSVKDDSTEETRIMEESGENDTTQSDSEVRYEKFRMVNPDEEEFYGESPTFIISYDKDGIQITLDFIGSNTYAMYEPDDTGFSARPEVISFGMSDESGMGIPSENNSTLELTVNGDKATMIFHTPEGEDSAPISFERTE